MQRPIQISALIKQKQNPRQKKQIKKKLLQPYIKLKVNNNTLPRSESTKKEKKKKKHIQYFKTTPCFPPKCRRKTQAGRERNAYA